MPSRWGKVFSVGSFFETMDTCEEQASYRSDHGHASQECRKERLCAPDLRVLSAEEEVLLTHHGHGGKGKSKEETETREGESNGEGRGLVTVGVCAMNKKVSCNKTSREKLGSS